MRNWSKKGSNLSNSVRIRELFCHRHVGIGFSRAEHLVHSFFTDGGYGILGSRVGPLDHHSFCYSVRVHNEHGNKRTVSLYWLVCFNKRLYEQTLRTNVVNKRVALRRMVFSAVSTGPGYQGERRFSRRKASRSVSPCSSSRFSSSSGFRFGDFQFMASSASSWLPVHGFQCFMVSRRISLRRASSASRMLCSCFKGRRSVPFIASGHVIHLQDVPLIYTPSCHPSTIRCAIHLLSAMPFIFYQSSTTSHALP